MQIPIKMISAIRSQRAVFEWFTWIKFNFESIGPETSSFVVVRRPLGKPRNSRFELPIRRSSRLKSHSWSHILEVPISNFTKKLYKSIDKNDYWTKTIFKNFFKQSSFRSALKFKISGTINFSFCTLSTLWTSHCGLHNSPESPHISILDCLSMWTRSDAIWQIDRFEIALSLYCDLVNGLQSMLQRPH